MLRKLLIIPILFIFVSVCFGATIGITSKGSTASTSWRFYGGKVTATENGTLNSITAFIKETNTTAKINFGYYLVNGTTVGNCVAHGTAVATGTYNDTYTMNVTGPITNGTSYWLVAQQESGGGATIYQNTNASYCTAYKASFTFDDWGNNPSVSYYGEKLTISATYTPEMSSGNTKGILIGD